MPRMTNSHGVTKKQTLHSISNVFKFRVISFNAYWKIRHGSFSEQCCFVVVVVVFCLFLWPP